MDTCFEARFACSETSVEVDYKQRELKFRKILVLFLTMLEHA